MDVLMLSRLQFAVATYFHFLFVPLTLGLSLLLALMETRYVITKDIEYQRMAKFWGKIFLINFIVGIVTGITLEFQFGTNWSQYSRFVGDIFGSLLAIEATAAFFLESTFIAVWAFGWKRLSPKAHAVSIWLVAIASNLSAVWILIANAWMQHPVGFVLRNGRAELTDFFAVITQKVAVLAIIHTLGAAYALTGFFIMGVSAYHLLRKQHTPFFMKSFRMALNVALVFSLFVVVEGHFHAADLAEKQPAKLAALESHWQTTARAPIFLFAIPDAQQENNRIQFGPIPGMLSLLAFHNPNAVVKGLKDFPKDERPPVGLTFFTFRFMVILGLIFIILTLTAWVKRNQLESYPCLLKTILYSIPLPYLACALGWTVAEVGRQPWIVYGVMRTSQAVSPIATSQVALSIVAFIVVYTFLGVVAVSLMAKHAKKGPEPLTSVTK
jgi:cytochrome bd quinol oxidase subunit 1 apoprotein (EC 1.10.3.-)